MPKRPNQKLRLLYLKEILEQHTDEEHYITTPEIRRLLGLQHLEFDRKTLYADIEDLKLYGFEIDHPEKSQSYKLLNPTFELHEIKLLADAIQTSKFLPQDKTEKLLDKLMNLVSIHQRNSLRGQVIVSNRAKNLNERILYNVSNIHQAIEENVQIEFRYFDYTIHKLRAYRKRGKEYYISPWALIYTDDNYYLLGYDPEKKEIRPFRVDRMDGVILCYDKPREGQEAYDAIDKSAYTNYTFSMYGGEIEKVTMVFQNRMMNAVIDRFGKDVLAVPEDKSHFRITVPAAVSQQFFGWVFGLGKSVRIVEPESVKKQMMKALADITERYEE